MPVSGSDGSHFETEWDYLTSQLNLSSPQAKDMPSREETDRQQKMKDMNDMMPPDMRGPPVTFATPSEDNMLSNPVIKDQNDPSAWGYDSARNRTGPAMVPNADATYTPIQAAPNEKPSNLEQAHNEMQLTPQERELYNRHITNLNGPGGVDNPDGSRSTLFATTVEADGKHYVIPTVRDGKILPPDQAVDLAAKEGFDKFPAYDTAQQATERYDQLHKFMEKDTKSYMKDQQKQHEEVQSAYDKVVKFLENTPLSPLKNAKDWTWRERLGYAISQGLNMIGPGRTPLISGRPGTMFSKEPFAVTSRIEKPSAEPANRNTDYHEIDRHYAARVISDNARPDVKVPLSELKGLINKYGEAFQGTRDMKTGTMDTEASLKVQNELKQELFDLQRSKMDPYDKSVEAQNARKGFQTVEGGLNNTWNRHSDNVYNLTNKEGKEIGSAVYRQHNDKWVGSRFNPENNQIIDRQEFNTVDEAMRYSEGDGPKLKQLQSDIKKIFGGTDASPEFRQIPWGFTSKQMSVLTPDEYHFFRNDFLSNNKFYRQWLDAFHDGVHNSNRVYFNPKSKTLSAKEKSIVQKLMDAEPE